MNPQVRVMEQGKLDRITATTNLLIKRTSENKCRAEHAVRWAKELQTTAAELRMELRDSLATARDLKATAKSAR